MTYENMNRTDMWATGRKTAEESQEGTQCQDNAESRKLWRSLLPVQWIDTVPQLVSTSGNRAPIIEKNTPQLHCSKLLVYVHKYMYIHIKFKTMQV